MTHVAHPYAQRLGIIRDWQSRWITNDPKRFREYVRTDASVRKLLSKELKGMYVASVEIERDENIYRIIITTSRPGLVIGRSGEGAQKLRKKVDMLLRTLKLSVKPEVKLDIEELRSPESSASVVGQMVVEGLEKRMPFRRVLKQTVEKVMANRDVLGVRIIVSGRLGGAEMARKEEAKKGRIPLQTLRADIDFASERAILPYGVIGIKVWIYKGDIFGDRKDGASAPRRGGRENNRG
ncbi:30S ribosomal protein S3 [Candidatus Kaiserbacteria bacterium]|nr:30S ribosomal protein S3 [Candidatus Kaiserbacteria bacterium]